jgi:uncharacterized protein YjiS (DUF1127 family)
MSPSNASARSAWDMRAKFAAGAISPVGLLRFLADIVRVRAERRSLMALDDRMLKDIGLSRGQAENEAGRSIFDVPQRSRRYY